MHKVENTYFSNTYNVFNKVKAHLQLNNLDSETLNRKINELSAEAYFSVNKTFLSIDINEFREECIIYKDTLYCFISNNDYKILFNYILNFGKISLSEISLTGETYNNIHNIKGIVKTTVNRENCKYNCSVINTYESFLDYCTINKFKKSSKINKNFFDNLKNSVNSSKTLKQNKFWGIKSNPSTSDNPKDIFNFIMLEDIIIITRYQKVLNNNIVDTCKNDETMFLNNFIRLEGEACYVAKAFSNIEQDLGEMDLHESLYVLQQIYEIPNEYLDMFNKIICIKKGIDGYTKLSEGELAGTISFFEANLIINQLSSYLKTL